MAKRVFDFVIAGTALVILSPVLVVIAILVRCKLGCPIFFVQDRDGLAGKRFRIIKFRTMKSSVDAAGRPLPDGDRMTRLGAWLRSSSLDELPELWNIVVGEMSLVGPRPLLPAYFDRYNEHQRRRLEVKPGLTGWAQVNGRNSLNWEERFDLDVWYVDHQSLSLDFVILFRTVGTVVSRSGVSADKHATMPEFFGKQEP